VLTFGGMFVQFGEVVAEPEIDDFDVGDFLRLLVDDDLRGQGSTCFS
jgi:hypothetical protein